MSETNTSRLETSLKFAQAVAVIIGVVISVITVRLTLKKEAETRQLELEKLAHQRAVEATASMLEATKPFLQLRQTYYLEAIKVAAILASPHDHPQAQLDEAKKRFWELYWAELALVDTANVAKAMKALGEVIEPGRQPTPQEEASVAFAHALRDSLLQSWGIAKPATGQLPGGMPQPDLGPRR